MSEEKRKRIRLALYAYAYEVHNNSLVSDSTYDLLSRSVNLDVSTDRPDLDLWFKNNYSKDTGMWIYNHPELHKIKSLYKRITNGSN